MAPPMRALAFATAVMLLGCDNAGSALGLTASPTGSASAQVYLDRDGSSGASPADTVYPGARLFLTLTGGGREIASARSDASGFVQIPGLVRGHYFVGIDPGSLGDSLLVDDISPPWVHVESDPSFQTATVRLSYPQLSIRAARAASLGRRVLIRGVTLAGVQSFRDTTSFVRDTSMAIRLTQVQFRGGAFINNPGDSVSVLGTVSSRAGQPTLDNAIITVFTARPAPAPLPVTSVVAAGAQGGGLDAALVSVVAMTISEAAPSGNDYRLVASDGSGPLTIMVDGSFVGDPLVLSVGRLLTVRGVLVPDGSGKWHLRPRGPSDVIPLQTGPSQAKPATDQPPQ